MQKILVKGGKPLFGKIKISGSKNSALPIIAASLMSPGTITIKNIPNISDVQNMLAIIKHTGSNAIYCNHNIIIKNNCKLNTNFSNINKIIKKIRGSSLIIGSSLAINGYVVIPATGGCNIGKRPIDIHLYGFKKLGAKIQYLKNSSLLISTPKNLQGTKIEMPKVSVGATENILMAAVMANGITEINNAAMEPEVVDLVNFLNKIGADIQGAGTPTITINGVKKLFSNIEYIIESDRIEAASYALAAIITKGEITLTGGKQLIQKSVLNKIYEAGGIITQYNNSTTIKAVNNIKPLNINTMPYPNFPSDMQPQFTALLSLASGDSLIKENIFENRFTHIKELKKMGANISIISNNTIQINGVKSLKAAKVKATNLRSAMSLIIAALSTNGETIITNPFHLDRGYENLELKLSQCGAQLKRLSENNV